jgi:hypothetical protein
MVMGIIDTNWFSSNLGLNYNTRDKGEVQDHFIIVDAAFAVVVMLIDILCPFPPKFGFIFQITWSGP